MGSYIVDELLKTNFNIKLINRKESQAINDDRCEEIVVDLHSEDLAMKLEGCDCVIYNIGIIREFPRKGVSFKNIHKDLAIHAVNMAEEANVRKFILMSANDVDLLRTAYERTKYSAEQYLIRSKLDWTIFRPSIIFGDPKGRMEFCTQVKRDMVNIPLPLPIFFSGFNIMEMGKFSMNPIHARNVAEFFIKSIKLEESNFNIYNLGGTKSYTWIEMLESIASMCGKKKYKIPVPFNIIKLASLFFDQYNWFPVTRDQLTMLADGNTCDSNEYFLKFNINEIPFDSNSLKYLS